MVLILPVRCYLRGSVGYSKCILQTQRQSVGTRASISCSGIDQRLFSVPFHVGFSHMTEYTLIAIKEESLLVRQKSQSYVT